MECVIKIEHDIKIKCVIKLNMMYIYRAVLID